MTDSLTDGTKERTYGLTNVEFLTANVFRKEPLQRGNRKATSQARRIPKPTPADYTKVCCVSRFRAGKRENPEKNPNCDLVRYKCHYGFFNDSNPDPNRLRDRMKRNTEVTRLTVAIIGQLKRSKTVPVFHLVLADNDDNSEGLERNGLHHLFVYADYVTMLEENPQTIRENMGILLEPSKAISLEVNLEKTKYMIMSRDQNIVRNGNIKFGNLSFVKVEKFKYLGATVYK
ncbi:hypothetical protein ANN_17838 [Periplaneta americana]|uniref:Reverse transcriptase domain-containing protein n=1 Tax=Periplaneta americana TaxID=6978 RepID=A0ABQ8SUM2_PERAM|nr:hypothetical protein ANN_17838 [Periplaneta americana]